MAIIEIIDDCNMHCPTCIAGSFPGAGNRRTMEEVELMLDTIVEREGYPDVVMISGGEPTIHPNIIEILHLAKSKPIKHLMLITNGVRIATDKEFVEELRKIKTGLEIYLQFDSLLPVNRLLFDESTTTNENEDLSFENTQGLKSMMYFLPDLDSNSVKYENLFRVTIVSILDHFNFCISAVKRSCIHFVTPLKEIIPLDTYYLLYAKRDDAQQLIPILRK
jgi:uncharacterized radical SAM superfamily Fe-S cluster-containing enzyme